MKDKSWKTKKNKKTQKKNKKKQKKKQKMRRLNKNKKLDSVIHKQKTNNELITLYNL